ncbi:EAL domain-containing protein [Thalassomonas actiniarum]|uniref:cyclic-guanylate-specific phosphodiesterase n=1 Tax=Thalassomonas actiniarum TaxID=485447 RepID=A0AAE9YUD7_9GAMM|nr:EAL domain-containing protein [Thalassomonas actiniarum]WDE01405.1 EAL domain-containing protein [Thalassomonas actiniarum]
MKNPLGSPLVRISVGLVMLTCSILLMFEFLGLVPNQKVPELKFRKMLVESLAVQLNADITANREDNVHHTLEAVVTRNSNVKSAGVRLISNQVIAQSGDHELAWLLKPADKSTASQVQVPIFKKGERWGTIEVIFDDLSTLDNPFFMLVLFVALSGFICYLLFLKKTMLELDPGSVVPDRVRNALNTLSDGLLIIDNKEQIIFSNEPFQKKSVRSNESLMGKKASELDWLCEEKQQVLPWLPILQGGATVTGAALKLRAKSGSLVSFKVNVSPIGRSEKVTRGALVTFNDITELEIKNSELGQLLDKLKLSQKEITAQNKELKYLATRDPLTSCLNRRSFFEGLRVLIEEEKSLKSSLSCIMSDIDHFKSVNDTYGHAVGDKVIKMVAKILKDISRTNDLVGRYGGEEFCVVLPATTAQEAAQVAERIRLAVMKQDISLPDGKFNVTSSFGVACWTNKLSNAEAFVSQADEALYVAKETGRNRVEIWNEQAEKSPEAATTVEDAELEINGAEPFEENGIEQAQAEPVIEINTLAGSEQESEENLYLNDGEVPLEHAGVSVNLTPDKNDERVETTQVFGLPSRIVMLDRIIQAIYRAKRNNRKFAILVLDLEKVRQISHTLGHSVSEKLIREMGRKISQIFRNTDCVSLVDSAGHAAKNSVCVSQISSYELSLLLDDFSRDEFLIQMLNRIFQSLENPVSIEGSDLYLDTCIGVSLYPNDGEEPDELIANASTAMYEARQKAGRNNFRFYSPKINQRANQQLQMENDLHKAVERNEFLVYYQPKVDVSSGQLCGMEALVRWQHPESGMVSPDDFIPLAETNGIIDAITEQVLVQVCGHLTRWQEASLEPVPVAINLSPVQFKNPQLAGKIIKQLKKNNILPKYIELEITENAVADNLAATIDLIHELTDAGFSISLDDFGTGYCSYSYLKNFPVDKIKIDRSIITDFTENTFDAAIVNSIITLADHLGLKIVAEGVETAEQLKFLRDLNCHQVQGYLISKPVPYEQATEFISDPSLINGKVKASLEHDTQVLAHDEGHFKVELTGILNKTPY